MKKFSLWLDEIWNGKHEPPSTILPPREKIKCKYCFAEIDPRAPVCSNCKEWQKRRPLGRLVLTYASSASALVAIVALIIAGWQLREARQKRVEAYQLKAEIDSSSKHFDAQIQTLRQLLVDSQKTLQQLKEDTDFNLALAEDNRPAFDRLRVIAADAQNPSFEKSKNRIVVIVSGISNSFGASPYRWKPGIQESKVTFEEAQQEFTTAIGQDAINLIFFIANNANYGKPQKTNFLMHVYREHESLRVVYGAELLLKASTNDKAFQSLPPFSFEQVEKWWEENKVKYAETK